MKSRGENYAIALYVDASASPEFHTSLQADFRAMGFKPMGAELAPKHSVVPGIPLVFVRDKGTHMPDGRTMFEFTADLKTRPEVKGIDRRGWASKPEW